jgi:hypothetical protein
MIRVKRCKTLLEDRAGMVPEQSEESEVENRGAVGSPERPIPAFRSV